MTAPDPREARYFCRICGEPWVVAVLASDCCTQERRNRLAKHAKEQR